MSPRVYNKRDKDIPKDAVYVGRPTAYGNPFVIGRDGTRMDVVNAYRDMVERDVDMVRRIRMELAGKDLVCWCAPEACHADVLLEIANS